MLETLFWIEVSKAKGLCKGKEILLFLNNIESTKKLAISSMLLCVSYAVVAIIPLIFFVSFFKI